MDSERLTLREWRRRLALTQEELAAKAGVTQGTVSDLEVGRGEPRISTIRKVAAALGIAPAQIIWEQRTSRERRGQREDDKEKERRAA